MRYITFVGLPLHVEHQVNRRNFVQVFGEVEREKLLPTETVSILVYGTHQTHEDN
jgi:hypothetical protein